MSKETHTARLAVYLLIHRDGKILMGKRKNAFGKGNYSVPAGHIEKGEGVMACGIRELFEETGIRAKRLEFRCVRLIQEFSVDGVSNQSPYVAFLLEANDFDGEPKNAEPEKCEGWEWHPINDLPEPLFPPVKLLMECLKKSEPFLD